MDKKRSSLGSNRSSKTKNTPENVFSGFHSPVSKSNNLYKSVLKDIVGKPASNHSKVRFSLGDSIKESPRERRTSGEADFHCSFDSDEENISLNTSFSCTQPVSQDAILQGVVAYIEARSNTENRFEGISKQMELLGAVVVKKFIPEVTHVIFKDGKKTTREKALKKGIHLVNVLWVESCRQSGKRVSEDLFPVVVPDEVHTPLVTGKVKRTKSMQPRSFEDDVRKSAERISRKKQRKIAAERTPTSTLSPWTRRLLSENSPAPASPLVSSESMKHVPDTPVYSGPNSPDQQDGDSQETELPSKRLDFEESNSAKEASKSSKCLKTVDTPDGSPTSVPFKTPVSPKEIPTDILQTASGPGKKRKRLQSSKESTSKEPDEKPKQKKKNKPTNSPHTNTDVFTFDEEDIPDIKTSKFKRTYKARSKSTSGVVNKIEKDSSSAVREDELENDLRANSLANKSKGTLISSSKQEDAQPGSTQSPLSIPGKILGSRDLERDLDSLVCATGLSDSGNSFNEVEMQEKKAKILKKNKRKFKKTENIVGEVESTEDENDRVEDVGKTSEPLKSTKKNKPIDRERSEAKKGVSKKKKGKTTDPIMNDEDQNIPDIVSKIPEDKQGKKDDVKETKPPKTSKNGSRRQKPIRRNISEDSYDDDDDDDDDDGNGKGRGISRPRKKCHRRTIPEDTDDEDDIVDHNDDGRDDDDHIKTISRTNKPIRRSRDTDDDDDNVDDDDDDDGNHDRITEEEEDESEINEGDDGEESVSHKPKEKHGIAKQKPKNKNRKKPSRSLVLTSMHFSEQEIVISVVRKLGGFYIADAVGPNTTHVISGSPRRTLNVLMAIAQGSWLVSPEWVMKSLETGYWVDEEPYELADAFPSAQLSRLERVSSGPDYRQELFADVDPIFVSDNTLPPRDSLIQLITHCGGKICTSIRKAGVVVGTISRKTKAINVSERWVLDSITEHTVLSLSPYVFNPTKSTSPTF